MLSNKKLANIFPDGSVSQIFRVFAVGFCFIQAEFFPYDSQLCIVDLALLTPNINLNYEKSLEYSSFISTYHNQWWVNRAKVFSDAFVPHNTSSLVKKKIN